MEQPQFSTSDTLAIHMSESARRYFQQLIDGQGGDLVGIRMRAVDVGTAQADCKLEFCEAVDLAGDELRLDCGGFTLFVEAHSAKALADAEVDFNSERTGGQLTIRAPHLKPREPGQDAPLEQRVRWLIDSEINPQLASHGGRVQLESIDHGVAVLRFGGGCHGCGMVDVTLKNGIEKTLREKLPDILGVRDATDHAQGDQPYYRRDYQRS